MGTVGLWKYAEDLLDIADNAGAATSPFSPGRYYTVCRSIELSLKCFLSLRGLSLRELFELGHNIHNLLEKALAVDLGSLVALSAKQLDAIKLADRYYGEKVFEYPALIEMVEAYRHLPPFAELSEAARVLVTALKPHALQA